MTDDVQRLAQTIKRAQWRDHRALEAALASVGTTLVQWDALRAIAARPGASGHELAEATFMSDQAFASLAGRLLRQGLVERVPGHGRRLEHHLTESGRQTLERGSSVADTTLERLFAGLGADERRRLQRLLDRLLA
ncbi:MarR family winged helix-turn-helix transcriptional regulator [Phycicoccus sonneratiae]|uniref:MarR family transcriptional regulator n=1 Tax=Phycicoccus sonneratiae TaxID=2807628 RepID=A0ABS2CI11_9MICO|nr:MarR family transcriptional regulator [Phycicoccus sonneraticus]MBM6398816.1 MarR family transcriptional regulator [Phycicoccus sonneraticus]